MSNNKNVTDTSSIQVFQNTQFGEIRVAENEQGEPIFCLADLCTVLELSAKGVNQRLSKDVISNYPLETNGGVQQALFVNEDGMYDVVLDSRKPEAKQFRKWLTSDVLPTLRKTGSYSVQKPLSTLELLELTIKGMRENHQELQEVKRDVLELKAKVTTRPEEFTIAGFATLNGMHVNLQFACKLGKAAKNLCRIRNIVPGSIPDPRFGKVLTYPTEVLQEVFALPVNA